MAVALPLPLTGARAAHAPFGRRAGALAIDAAILAVILWALALGARGLTGVDALLVLPWREAPVVSVDRQFVALEDERLYDNSGHRRVTFHAETRRYADGTLRVYSIGEGTVTLDDGSVENVRSELLVARNGRAYLLLVAVQVVGVMLPFVYFAAFEAGKRQATPGKRALGIKVTDRDGARMGPIRALARQVLKLCDVATTGFGYALAFMTGSGQALHDILAGTRVVTAEPDREGR
ncbi:MAG: RDD family protein [Tagaea sp.]